MAFELRRRSRSPPIDLGVDEQTKDLIHLLSTFATQMDNIKATQMCSINSNEEKPKKSLVRPKPMIDDTYDTLHGDSLERIFDRIIFSVKSGEDSAYSIASFSLIYI
jgi:hypothetical protein